MKIVVFILLGYTIIALLNLNSRIAAAQNDVITLTAQVEQQLQKNEELAASIALNEDPEHRMDIAREKLDLLEPGEKVFYITD